MCFLGVNLRQDLLLIELREGLSLVDLVIDIRVKLFDDARRLAFDLNLGDGLNFSVATTERATSPRCTLAIRFGSMFVVRTSLAAPTPITTITNSATEPIQIQIFLLLREAMEHPQTPTRALVSQV